jgi:AraC family transcriptional regulator of adaptative response / DNA-3-methyladenine glycosylase II
VGVSTTGIYCRPVCTAKQPRRDRCTFYPNPAAAERAGYRPCLRCRPELAPGKSAVDSTSRLAAQAARRIEDGALNEMSVSDLAEEMGVTDRHLRRVVETELGVTPIELAQTQRLLLAKRLLTDTHLPIGQIAFASGFSSLRRFNALFSQRYRLSPGNLRKRMLATSSEDVIVCDLAYRPPYDWESLIGFLASHRTCAGIEEVSEGRYIRTAAVGKHKGWFSVQPLEGKHSLRVEVSVSLAPALTATLARVKRIFDLAASPQQIAAHLGPLAESSPGMRVPGTFDGFEMAIRAILGQQVTVKAAQTLMNRFAGAFGERIETPFESLCLTMPAASRVATLDPEEIIQLGILPSRARSILALSQAVAEKKVRLTPGSDVESTMAALKELPGIGEWTAQYVAMRALSWPDALPHTDLGLYKALGTRNPKEVIAAAEKWRPWRSYAVMHLWKSLEAKP